MGLSRHTRTRRGLYVLTLDDENGPYTSAQRVAIERLLKRRCLKTLDEALIRLHRYIGLRPIQTALLREQDLSQRNGAWYLAVPLVKGRYATGRRHAKRFAEYKLPDDVADALKRLIDEESNNPLVCPMTNSKTLSPAQRPLFKAGRRSETTLPQDIADAEYHHHLTPATISNRFLKISRAHAVVTREADPRSGKTITKPVRITAYRFRYTVGTLLAQKGATLREIAHWLGHKGEESVRFYVQMAEEYWDHDLILSAHPHQQKAIAALGGNVANLPTSADGEVAIGIPRTGTCVLPPGVTECPLNPMMSCLSCPSLRDTTNTVDEAQRLIAQAVRDNEAERRFWESNSTCRAPLGMLAEREAILDLSETLARALEG